MIIADPQMQHSRSYSETSNQRKGEGNWGRGGGKEIAVKI